MGIRLRIKLRTIKKFARKIHLWLALAASITITISLITGLIYIFKDDIQQGFVKVDDIPANDTAMSIEQIENKLTSSMGELQYIKIPQQKDKPIIISPKKNKDKSKKRKYYYVNPYNGEIIKEEKLIGEGFFRFNLRLHRWLFMDKVGKVIMGTSTIILIFVLLTGIILWLPKKIKNIRQRLVIRAKRGNKLLYELHMVVGFYASIFIIIMALTGLFWSFDWYRDAYKFVLGVKTSKKNEILGNININKADGKIKLYPLINEANKILTHKGDLGIFVRTRKDKKTKKESTTLFISKNVEESFLDIRNRITVNAETGNITRISIFDKMSFGEKIYNLNYALHVGSVFGLTTKIIYAIASLIGIGLPITGIILWIKRTKRKKNKRKYA